MTEVEWLALNEGLMLHHIEEHHSPSPRKLRLLTSAFARFLQEQPEYADSKQVAHLGEDVADGRATLDDLWDDRVRGWGFTGDWAIANLVLAADARLGNSIRRYVWFSRAGETGDQTVRRRAALRPLIHCIFGNPFRPVAFNPAWRTDTALILARQMYESREFGAMPILADALQDAGCEDEQVLRHCRAAGPHARGCWVVDGVLGLA